LGAVDLRAAAAWTDAEVNGAAAAPQLTGLRPAQTARLTTTAGIVWRPVDAAVLEVDARHEGERFDDDLNTRRLKAAVTLDARAAWTFAPGTEVYIALDNLADARIPAAVAGDGAVSLAAPRTVRMGLTLRR
jgi:outer membrane receptor protein involved in Fe transport